MIEITYSNYRKTIGGGQQPAIGMIERIELIKTPNL